MHNDMTPSSQGSRGRAGDAPDRRFAYAFGLYPVAAYLMIMPVFDVVVRSLPLNVRNEAWRYAVLGITFTNMGTFLLGWALTIMVAALQGRRLLLRVMFVASVVATMVTLSASGIYGLDALQLQAVAKPAQKVFFLKGAATALLAAFLGTLSFAALAVSARRAIQVGGPGGAKTAPSSDPVMSVLPNITRGVAK